MVFDALYESAEEGELILVDGGLCRWHLRKDGQLTIREIVVLPEKRKQGIGRKMLDSLKQVQGTTSIFAKCPEHLTSNKWYKACGFACEGQELTSRRNLLNLWRLSFAQAETEGLLK